MHIAALVFIDIAIIMVVARLFGRLAIKIGQPPVVGEIVAGIALGPSLLGLLPGDLETTLFPPEVLPVPEHPGPARPGAVHVHRRPRAGHAADPRPGEAGRHHLRGVGGAAVRPGRRACRWCCYPSPRRDRGRPGGAAGARPVPGRRDVDHRLPGAGPDPDRPRACTGPRSACWPWPARPSTTSSPGRCWRSSWRWCRATARWTCCASSRSPPSSRPFMFGVVRPALRRLNDWYRRVGRLTPDILSVVLIGVLVSAFVTEMIGIHAIFGAFVFGAVMPRQDAADLTTRDPGTARAGQRAAAAAAVLRGHRPVHEHRRASPAPGCGSWR